jgi:hypothetical protein
MPIITRNQDELGAKINSFVSIKDRLITDPAKQGKRQLRIHGNLGVLKKRPKTKE